MSMVQSLGVRVLLRVGQGVEVGVCGVRGLQVGVNGARRVLSRGATFCSLNAIQ